MDGKPNRETSLGHGDMCWINIPIDSMLIERELEELMERKMIKRIEWNVNEEIAEDILKAEEKYNMYKNSNTFLKIHFSLDSFLYFY